MAPATSHWWSPVGQLRKTGWQAGQRRHQRVNLCSAALPSVVMCWSCQQVGLWLASLVRQAWALMPSMYGRQPSSP